MARFDYECRDCGFSQEEIHPADLPVTECPSCHSDRYAKVFNFMPGFNGTTIRQVSERDPAYFEWVNSDKVKEEIKAGVWRPVKKSDDIAHGGSSDEDEPYESPRDKETRFAGYQDEFHKLGCPDIAQQAVLQEQGKM